MGRSCPAHTKTEKRGNIGPQLPDTPGLGWYIHMLDPRLWDKDILRYAGRVSRRGKGVKEKENEGR